MINKYKELIDVLERILLALEQERFLNMDDLLEKREVILKDLNQVNPNEDNALEIAKLISASIELEKRIVETALEKKQLILKRMNEFHSRKTAFAAYSTQSMIGAVP